MRRRELLARRLLAWLGLFIGLAGLAVPAQATIEEILVTARKKEESLQDVPVVVTALDENVLGRHAVRSIEDISQIVPGLHVQEFGGPAQAQLTLRGIGAARIGVGMDSPVSINVDGVQVANGEFLRSGVFDLERVEVLKGPQSLYFGKNSPGGILYLKSADPTDELFTEFRVGYDTEAEGYTGHVIVSGPFNDQWGGRLAVQYTDSQGWYEYLNDDVQDGHGPDFDEIIARLTIAGAISDSVDAKLKIGHSRREGGNMFFAEIFDCDAGTIPVAVWAPDSDCKLNHKGTSSDPSSSAAFDPSLAPQWKDDPTHEYENTYVVLDLSVQISETLTLNSLTGYTRVDNFRHDSAQPGVVSFVIGEEQYQTNLSQELRLTGDFGRYNVTVGAFADDRRLEQDSTIFFFAPNFPTAHQQVDSESWSVFAQVEFDLTDQLALSVGGRYTDETREYSGEIVDDRGLPGYVTGTALIPLEDEVDGSDFSPEVTLTFRPTDGVTLFASYKEGFKSAGFNTSQLAGPALALAPPGTRPLDFLEENVDGFEVGVKSQWLDDTLRLNVSAFQYDYEDIQLSALDRSQAVPTTRVFNAGAARIEGVEVETLFRPSEEHDLTLTANLQYLNAEYTDFVSRCFVTSPCNLDTDGDSIPDQQDRDGTPLANAPEWSVQLGIAYGRQISESLYFTSSVDAIYEDEYVTDADNESIGLQDSTWLLNASIGISAADESWQLDLIGKNLTDEVKTNLRSRIPVSNLPYATTNPPRTFVVQFTYRL